LIAAESGTGKELVARAIHRQGPRRSQPFVAVNLAAIPDTLVESELFGHEKGSFTGAHARKIGKFELAHGGTLFLDEVGTLRIDLQAKLLRALQEREIERLGGTHPIPVDLRVLAATNVDLKAAVRARTFREDLYYRLNVVPVTIPPLRARKSDIPILVEHFLRKYSQEFKKDVRGISRGALPALQAYDWPGHVRELENIVERGVALATGPVVRLDDLPVDLAIHEVNQRAGSDGGPVPLPLQDARDRFEQAYVLRALERENWNRTRAARALGMHRNTLLARLAAWGVRREDVAGASPPPGGGPLSCAARSGTPSGPSDASSRSGRLTPGTRKRAFAPGPGLPVAQVAAIKRGLLGSWKGRTQTTPWCGMPWIRWTTGRSAEGSGLLPVTALDQAPAVEQVHLGRGLGP